MAPLPITVVTGFLGSGKTTLILKLLPQLPKTYKLALLKNEFGDLAVDSQLASSQAISGVRELLNGCICCNLVGQLSEALIQLRTEVAPDRIVIETSGSAFPATLAMEINRLAAAEEKEEGAFVLDGVVSVIDVENWRGYEDTSYTAALQARFNDLIVFNKWEEVSERRFDDCLDRLGDLEVQFAWVKSRKGWVDQSLLMGIDGALVSREDGRPLSSIAAEVENAHHPHHPHHPHHHEEVEVLSVTLDNPSSSPSTITKTTAAVAAAAVDLNALETDFLLAAPKDEIYRIKGLVLASKQPNNSTATTATTTNTESTPQPITTPSLYILNWAFGRWTYTLIPRSQSTPQSTSPTPPLRLTVILARGEATKWQKRLREGRAIRVESQSQSQSRSDGDGNGDGDVVLTVERVG